MSQENVELWRASIEELLGGTSQSFGPDAAASRLGGLWHADIEWDASEAPLFDLAGVYRGKEAVRQWFQEWFAAWETLQFEYELVDAGDRVVLLIDLRMRGRCTGLRMAFGKHAFVATFRDGLMVHNKLYMSQPAALDAVGLRE